MIVYCWASIDVWTLTTWSAHACPGHAPSDCFISTSVCGSAELTCTAPVAFVFHMLTLCCSCAACCAVTGLPDCIAWRAGMLKPATSSKQSQSFWKLYGSRKQQPHVSAESLGAAAGAGMQQQQQLQALLTAAVLSSSAAQQLLPGVQLQSTTSEPADLPGGATAQADCAANTQQDQQQAQRVQRQRQRQAKRQQREQQLPPGWSPESSAALHVAGGITLQVCCSLCCVGRPLGKRNRIEGVAGLTGSYAVT